MTAQELKDVKIRMKPPLSYYGGKQKLARDICRALYQSPNWDAAVEGGGRMEAAL